jgi:hypothetical protein
MPSVAYAEHGRKKRGFFFPAISMTYVISLAAHPCAPKLKPQEKAPTSSALFASPPVLHLSSILVIEGLSRWIG